MPRAGRISRKALCHNGSILKKLDVLGALVTTGADDRQDRILTKKQVAEMFQMSQRTIDTWIERHYRLIGASAETFDFGPFWTTWTTTVALRLTQGDRVVQQI